LNALLHYNATNDLDQDLSKENVNDGHDELRPRRLVDGRDVVFPLLFWILVIAGVAFITRWFLERSKDNDESGRNEATALDILKKRYASGEEGKRNRCFRFRASRVSLVFRAVLTAPLTFMPFSLEKSVGRELS